MKIEYFEGEQHLDTVDFHGSREEAIRAAEAGLVTWDAATHALVRDEAGRVLATVHPR